MSVSEVESLWTHACSSPHALPLIVPCTAWCHPLFKMVKWLISVSGICGDWMSFRERWDDWIVPVSVYSCNGRAGAVVGWGGTWLLSLPLAHSPEIGHKLVQIRALFSAQASSLTFPQVAKKESGRWSRCSQVESNWERNDWNIREWALWCLRDKVGVCEREKIWKIITTKLWKNIKHMVF